MIIVSLGAEIAGGSDVAALIDHDRFAFELPGAGRVAGNAVAVRHERWTSGSCTARHDRSWECADSAALLAWLGELVPGSADGRVCVVAPERDLGFASSLLTVLGGDHCLIFERDAYEADVLRMENGAFACAVVDAAMVDGWVRQHPFPVDVVDPTQAEALVGFVEGDESTAVGSAVPDDGDLLIVSYFGPPSNPVSIKRLGYWHDEIERISGEFGEPMSPWWLSATRRCRPRPRCLFVADPGDDAFDRSAPTVLNEMASRGLSEVGAAWELAVRRTVSEWPGRFESVVISAGPFGYLGLAEFFARQWGARVVVDFRDPLAQDSRRNFRADQRAWLADYERSCARHAAALVSVNQTCLAALAPGVSVERRVIANGFDERLVPGPIDGPETMIRLVYAGTIYPKLGFGRVIDALDPSRVELVHYGRDHSAEGLVGSQPGTRAGGFVDDPVELAEVIAAADLGLIRTGGEPIEQTTKLFDYLGAGIEVLIVTDGVPRTGDLHDVTRGTPGVHWVRNDVKEITAFLAGYRPHRPDRSEIEHLSRDAQTRRLVELVVGRSEGALERPVGVRGPVAGDQIPLVDELMALRRRVTVLEAELAKAGAGLAGVKTGLRTVDRRSATMRLDRQFRAAAGRGRRALRRRLVGAGELVVSARPVVSVREQRRRRRSARQVASGRPVLMVVAPSYPVGGATYGGQPVARRVRQYRAGGYVPVVFVPSSQSAAGDVIDEDGTRVVMGPAGTFDRVAGEVRPDLLAVHSPLPETWPDLQRWAQRVPTVVWFHGFESRDWRLLSFDYTAAEIEREGPRLDAVMAQRRQLLAELFVDAAIEQVFVSAYLRTVAEEFVGAPARNGQVIHNVIDTDLFAFRQRTPEERFSITAVRSFARRNYGTDMIAPVVRGLRDHPSFDRVNVSVVGTGRFFARDLASLAEFRAVETHERVLTAAEVSAHLDAFGVALLPTRWDSQGMLMGEAMAAGAVPVTNAVAAIPEFADHSVACLAPGEDHRALAAGIAEMFDDPDGFMDRSAAARRRVVEQCGPDVTTRREVALFDRLLGRVVDQRP